MSNYLTRLIDKIDYTIISTNINDIEDEEVLENNFNHIPLQNDLKEILLKVTIISADCCLLITSYITSYTKSSIDDLMSIVDRNVGKYKDHIQYNIIGIRRSSDSNNRKTNTDDLDVRIKNDNLDVKIKNKNLNGDFLLLKVILVNCELKSILYNSKACHLAISSHTISLISLSNVDSVKCQNRVEKLFYIPMDTRTIALFETYHPFLNTSAI